MENEEITDSELITFEKAYKEMLIEAYKQFPNLRVDMQTYNDTTVGIADYNKYLNIVNQQPIVVTSNHIS